MDHRSAIIGGEVSLFFHTKDIVGTYRESVNSLLILIREQLTKCKAYEFPGFWMFYIFHYNPKSWQDSQFLQWRVIT